MKILYVEDDPEAQAFVSRALRESGFVIDTAGDGETGFELASAGAYDVLILDVKLPGMSGFELLRRLRRAGVSVPVLFLTAQGEVADRIEGLELGADDYLAKPFAFNVLLARIRALLRRQRGERAPILQSGDLTVDPAAHRVLRGEAPVELTSREFAVLEALMRRGGDVMSKLDIIEHVWDFAFEGDPNIVEVYIRRLRNKLDRPFGRAAIETIRGAGYRLTADGG
jgi:two-component system OmpR family response regulator